MARRRRTPIADEPAAEPRALPGDDHLLKKVAPYHSDWERDQAVSHDRTDCPYGRKIRSSHMISGRGGLPRCWKCRELDDELDLTE